MECEEKGHVIAEVTFDSKGRQREQKKRKEKKEKKNVHLCKEGGDCGTTMKNPYYMRK